MKKIFTLLLAVAASTAMMHAAIVDGTCGDNLSWSLNTKDSTLTVTGSGKMTNWSNRTSVPWYEYRSYIKTISFPDGVTNIGSYAFYECSSLISVNISDSVTSIGDYAFDYCTGLTSVTIPKSVTSIGDDAFSSCDNLTAVHISDIAAWCAIDFSDWNGHPLSNANNLYLNEVLVTDLVIPDSVTNIARYAFFRCRHMTSLTIGSNVRNIGRWAFGNCIGLTSITMPVSNISIEEDAFINCRNLTNLVIYATTPPSNGHTWGIENNSLCNLYVPKEAVDTYANSIWWEDFAQIRSIDDIPDLSETNPSNVPASNSDIVGTSYTINGNFNAGLGSIQSGAMPDKGVKFRTNKTAGNIPNAIEFTVNNGFAITGISIVGVTNTNDAATTIGSIYVDGELYNGSYDGNIPARNSNSSSSIEVNQIDAKQSVVFAFSELNGVTQANLCYTVYYKERQDGDDEPSEPEEPENPDPEPQSEVFSYDLTAIGLTINDWTAENATLNEGNSSNGRYSFDVAGGAISLAYVTTEPRIQFQYSNLTDKANAFFIYPSKCFEFYGKNGILRVLNTTKGDTIRLSVAAKGSSAANFEGTGYPINATALTEDLVLPAKNSPGADANGYVWRILEYVSQGGDVEIKEFDAGYRLRSVGVIEGPSVAEDVYYVYFYDWDATVLKVDSVEYGNAATAPTNPTREGYTFTGWDKDFSNITQDTIVTAQYKINRYEVLFLDWDESVLKKDSVDYNTAATAPADPEREGYTFTGWDIDFSNITQDTIVTALYDKNNEPVSTIPTPADLAAYGDLNTGVVLCLYFDPEVCNDIVLVGSYNGWNTNVDSLTHFEKMTGFDGWYVASFPFEAGENSYGDPQTQAKAVQLKNDGSFDWQYQTGDAGAWLHKGGKEARIENSIYNEGESNVSYTEPGAYIYEVAYWKDYANPCEEAVESYAQVQIGDLCYNLNPDSLTAEVTYKGEDSYDSYSGLTTVTIPAMVTYNAKEYRVTSIGISAFVGSSSLRSVTLPNSVKRIEADAFKYCTNLESVNFPDSIESIGDEAFFNCNGLTTIELPSSVMIGERVFPACHHLTSIQVAENNPYYSSEDGVLFNKDKTTLIQYPIGKNSTSYIVPNTVTSIAAMAFLGSTLSSIEIPNTVTNIGAEAFEQCDRLTSIEIPSGVTTIRSQTFYYCTNLTTVNIPEGVTKTEYGAFACCFNLTSIVLPQSITHIGYDLIYGAGNLTSITCKAVNPPVPNDNISDGTNKMFNHVDKSVPLYVPAESIDLYKSADEWKEFINIFPIQDEPEEEPIETIEGDYTVYYVNKDNQDLSEEVVTLHVPVAPAIEGFTFIGWQIVSAMLSEGITLQAVYTVNDFTSVPEVYTNPSNPAQKLIKNGNVYILRDDKTYTITGQAL